MTRPASFRARFRSTPLAPLAVLALASAFAGCGDSASPDGGGAMDAASSTDGPATQPDLLTLPAKVTLHYHRAQSDYMGWTVTATAGGAAVPATPGAEDGWGATFTLTPPGGTTTISFELKNGNTSDAAGMLSVDYAAGVREAWIISSWPEAITRALPAIPASRDQVAYYYLRGDAKYDGWGLHLWGEKVTETSWGAPLSARGVDSAFGAGFLIDLKSGSPAGNCPAGKVCVIAHQANTKDPGPDMSFDPKVLGNVVFMLTGSTDITSVPRRLGEVGIAGVGAHLLDASTLAWCFGRDGSGNCTGDPAITSAELRVSPTAEIVSKGKEISGGTVIALTPRQGGPNQQELALSPWLAGSSVFTIAPADQAKIPEAVKGQMVAVARKMDGSAAKATQVEASLYLDATSFYNGPLGVTFANGLPTLDLWAPTATAVKLHVYDAQKAEIMGSPFPMNRLDKGVWEYKGDAKWAGLWYAYELTVYHPATGKIETLTVTDPWSVNVDINGKHSQILDLADPSLKPGGWDQLVKPALAAPEDIVVYESHVRDFSASDTTVAPERRGKYLGFVTENGAQQSDGLKRLAALARAGLTHIHLLPSFDFATVDEDPAKRVDIDAPFANLCQRNPAVPMALCGKHGMDPIRKAMASYPADSSTQQEIAGYMRSLDSFNWGYDPFHFGVPEGSYASTADGSAKVLEFRRMVKGLADIGLRVVFDVVYNHTNASGIGDKAVLDKVVPNYYHRLDPDSGFVLTSSCCANTASEHKMMERLIVDTVVRFARDYKIDGFRFDLMGLHTRDNMVAIRAALDALTVQKDGVDGNAIYVYGEGWDMGEMAKNARGVNANQKNMAGTGIGTFNDRLRDGARGGGPFDSGADLRKNQGFGSGLYFDPNEASAANPTTLEKLGTTTDWIKVGMAGSLGDFKLLTYFDSVLKAAAVGYNGADTGYTKDPQESINYVAAHDNQDLWDILSYKLPTGTPTADRVRAHNVMLDTVLLGQGIPFVHMGDDLLRSKSMDTNSYDSGDWFNFIDWSFQTTAFATGLPPQGDNNAAWNTIKPIFADATAKPGQAHIAAAATHFTEMLTVRKSSPLFRLRTAADVVKRVDFLNAGKAQVPGVIVMTISDAACAGADLDPNRDGLVVVINADKKPHTVGAPGAGGAVLHATLAGSTDAVVKTSSVMGSMFTVPARTSAVFELPQTMNRGSLPCNAR